jgi:hypothetical protein
MDIQQIGQGVGAFRLMVYPKTAAATVEQKKKMIKDGRHITVHITGRAPDLVKLLGPLVKQVPPQQIDRTKDFYWFNMPEFKGNPATQHPFIYVGFFSEKDKIKFGEELGVKLNENSRYMHYPYPIMTPTKMFRYSITYKINPRFPIYIISLGRWKTRHTVKTLEAMNCPYKIVVEPREYKKYAEVIDPAKIIKAPENFSDQKRGGIPVRNFVWEHAVKSGAKKHWILDDNIRHFYRWNLNARWRINSGVLFRLIEDYVSRFTNIKQAGMNYAMFAPSRSNPNPITFNTRIFSCILIDHDLDNHLSERWRGKYNEDVDLSLRILKKGFGTALFNAFLCGKLATLTTPGGNTDTIYAEGAKQKLIDKAQSLVAQHPDVASIVQRYKRGWHHEVKYSKFKKNKLGYKNPNIPRGTNEYNMKLVKIKSSAPY